MSDNYQAVYDAVRSRFHCNVEDAIQPVVRDAFSGVDRYVQGVADEHKTAAYEMQRPSVLYRPTLSMDGDQWCALYGIDLQQGVAGFGDTPAKAMAEFDAQWQAARTAPTAPAP